MSSSKLTSFNLAATLEVKERVVKDLFVTLDGYALNVEDMIDLIGEIQCGNVELKDRELGELLIKHGILKTMGSRRWLSGAEEGPNCAAFLTELMAL